MSTASIIVIPCGCCRELVEPALAYFDNEIRAHVCEDCRVELRAAQAQLSRSASAPADGLAAMTIICAAAPTTPPHRITATGP